MEKSFEEREKGRQEALKHLAKHRAKVKIKKISKENIPKFNEKSKHDLKGLIKKGMEKRFDRRKKEAEEAYHQDVMPKERAKIIKKHAKEERLRMEKKNSTIEKIKRATGK